MATVSFAINLAGVSYLSRGAPDLGGTLPALTDVDAAVVLVDTGGTSAALIDLTTLAAAMAVLVADGATPTQAHVNDADAALTAVTSVIGTAKTDVAAGVAALDPAIAAYEAALTAATGDADGDAVFTYDAAVFDTIDKKRKLLNLITWKLGLPGAERID